MLTIPEDEHVNIDRIVELSLVPLFAPGALFLLPALWLGSTPLQELCHRTFRNEPPTIGQAHGTGNQPLGAPLPDGLRGWRTRQTLAHLTR